MHLPNSNGFTQLIAWVFSLYSATILILMAPLSIRKLFKSLTIPVDMALRSQQIALTVSRYGVAEGLGALGIEVGKRGLSFAGVKNTAVPLDGVFGRKLAKLFVKLGPTFIKLGQVLATRPDITGEPVAEELKILFDRVPGVPFRRIQKILKQEIGKQKLKTAFKKIDPKPLASASISQTHRATLADGTPVILKVQKPGVAELVRVDLLLLELLVRSVNPLNPKLQLLQMFQDFKESTLREVDYRAEAKNIDRFRKNYRKIFSDSEVSFPKYFPDVSTERVLALEPMHGKKVSEMRQGSTVARKAASAGLAAVLEQIFDHGFFHADPHAGNLFFLEDEGRLGFIDLGMVGQLEAEDKRKFLKVLLAVLNRDRGKLARSLFELGTASKQTKFDKFDKAVQGMLDDMKAKGVDNLRLDQMLNRLLSISRQNGIHIPNRYIMMIRSCLVIEGVARSLDPKISIAKVATPIVARSLMRSYNPIRFITRLF